MAYVSIEQVKEIRAQISPVLKSKGFKGSLKREDTGVIVLSVKSEGVLINQFTNWDSFNNWHNLTDEQQAEYFKYKKRREEISKVKEELKSHLYIKGYKDNSDIMTDYFDVNFYSYFYLDSNLENKYKDQLLSKEAA